MGDVPFRRRPTRLAPSSRLGAGGGVRSSSLDPVSRAEADSVVRRYVAAYEAEARAALGALFAPDIVQRSEGTGTENRGKDAVLADYTLQFQIADNPEYTFTPTTFAEGHASSRLVGTTA